MTLHNKILPVALVAVLLGGTVGALVMHNHQTNNANAPLATTQPTALDTANMRSDQLNPAVNADQQAALNGTDANGNPAYRAGFTDGFAAARNGVVANRTNNVTSTERVNRVVYSPTTRTRYARSSRQAYYDYAPRQRSFWQKHRDKLTVAMGTGGGALLGGLIGGKKGAAIGALAGGGGSALYTYKIRNRHRHY